MSGHHQRETLELLLRLVGKESIVVDIGAHVGTLTVPLARAAKHVIAFEPAPLTFALLEQNVAQNRVDVDARNKGLGAVEGRASLLVRDASNAGAQTLHIGEGPLTLGVLDREVAHADLIKIDAEGMELDILKGGARLITDDHPIILCEVHLSQLRSHRASPAKLERFFRLRGYTLYFPHAVMGGMRLGLIRNLTVLTLFLAPRASLLYTPSAPFDILALPKDTSTPLATDGFLMVLLFLVREHVVQKIRRIRTYFSL